MKLPAFVVVSMLATSAAGAQHGSHSPPASPAPALDGLGELHHPVSTRNAEAQRFFDQGLRLSFAFNHDEAFRAFRRAADLDPALAMAYWGMALVLGPNINLPIDETRARQAHGLVRKAADLARQAPERERAYVEALAKRYAADPKADRAALDVAYKEAMGELMRRYPDDLDAATLYAEAAMDLRPWRYWRLDGTPAEGTQELIEVLRGVLRRDPEHIGANHLLIHAVEASPDPEMALGSAHRLERLAPGAGHLVHMPSHIYARLGDHEASARINDRAADVDRQYVERHKISGMYPLMYFTHNLHFSAYSHASVGRHREAMSAAEEVYRLVEPAVREMPMVEMFALTPLLVQIRFRRWDDLASASEPPSHLPITRGVWRFGRGMALAAKGDRAGAEAERKALGAAIEAVPTDVTVGFSPARTVLGIAANLLDARLAESAGDATQAADQLARGVAAEDGLPYDEPPDWYLHVRESLGGLLLRQGKPAEAERVFRADLERNPRNPRSLFGLREALAAQKKTEAAAAVDREFRAAWKGGEGILTVAGL